MLTAERHKLILEKLHMESVVYLNDLMELLDASESTVRRDLNAMHKAGLLKKVHGGATLKDDEGINTKDDDVEIRKNMNINEKIKIAKYAASLIKINDFVYIDAGTTTQLMIDFIEEKRAVFITNGIAHAKKLIKKGCAVYIVGGEVKPLTEAIVGAEAVGSIKKYNFTKAFFGTNGIDIKRGYTTPDIKEAILKEAAMTRSEEAYILSDHSKFGKVSSVTFGDISNAKIITAYLEDNIYKRFTKITEVDKQ